MTMRENTAAKATPTLQGDQIDLYGRLCPLHALGGPLDVPMADYSRGADIVWGALSEALQARGWSEAAIITWLQSRESRWALDWGLGEGLRKLGRAYGEQIADEYLRHPPEVDEVEASPPGIDFIAASPANIAAARSFLLMKWQCRAEKMGHDRPGDLSGSCKFTSLFAQAVFGGTLAGNFFHQWVELPGGVRLDLNDLSTDVHALQRGDIPADAAAYAAAHGMRPPRVLYTHDADHMAHPDTRESIASVRPRVQAWIGQFRTELQARA